MKKLLLLSGLILVFSSFTDAQWLMQVSGFPNESTGAFYISVVSKDIAWISARDGLNAPYISNEFSRTTNGGAKWTVGQVISGTAIYDIANISAFDENIAWAGIYHSYGAQDSVCGIYKTTDGGATWVQQFFVENNSSTYVNGLHFWNANEGVFYGNTRNGYFEIYTTSNGGTAWNRIPQININDTIQTGGEIGFVRAFETVGDSMFCFITSTSSLYISTDRGYHWIRKPTGITIPPNCWFKNIAFHDENHGLIGFATSTATTMNVHETSDGGNTWTLVNSTGPINLFALAAIPGSPNTYVSTGHNASMINDRQNINHSEETSDNIKHTNSGVTYSFDGGHTWQKMPSTDNKHFLAIKWLNDSVAFAGSWNNNPNNDGMYKFTSKLAKTNFTANDTAVDQGEQVLFSIISGGHSTSTYNWTFPGGTPGTSNSSNPIVTYNIVGTYDVTLNIINTWGNSSEIKLSYIRVGNGGIEKLSPANISLFPNPSEGLLTITGSFPILHISICDLLGKVVYDTNTNESKVIIKTTGLKAGVYNLIIYMQNEKVNKKIVIN